MISSEEITSTKFFSRAYPKERVNKALPDIALWIQSKQNLDQLHTISKLDHKKYPNLWRVHDGIYDFTNFQHPGGYDFLEMTANTDVTELFESSHPNIEKARALLSKYRIDLPKEISLPPRNTDRLLFEPDGFYCTLRSRIFEVLKTIKTVPYLQSTSFVLDSLLIGYFVVQILSISPFFSPPVSYALALLSGFLLACLANCSHNFWHLKNNWRMYSFDLTCYSSYEWRISHGYSHHTYPNSVLDYEVWAFEPLLYFLPIAGKKNVNSFLPLFFILTVFPVGMFLALLKRIPMILTFQQKFRWEHTLPLINALLLIVLRHHFLYSNSDIPIYPFQRQEVIYVLKHLFITHSSCSFIFYILGLGGVHHHPNVWHAGDNPAEAPGNGGKNDKGIDFGIYQLIAVGDRPSVDESLFLSAISFGRHCLHHMFPTIDLCVLPQLVPVFNQTCKEFKVEYFISGNEKDENHKRWPKHRSFGMFEGWLGVYQQAVRANVDVTNFPPLETKKNTK